MELLASVAMILVALSLFLPIYESALTHSRYVGWRAERHNDAHNDPDLVAFYDFQRCNGVVLRNKARRITSRHYVPEILDAEITGGRLAKGRWPQAGKTALYFDGMTRIEIPHCSEFEMADELTLEAWIRALPRTTGGPFYLFSKFDAHEPPWIGPALWLAGPMGLDLGGCIPNETCRTLTSQAIFPPYAVEEVRAGAWHHVVLSGDGRMTRLYLDGRLVGERALSAVSRDLALNQAPLYVGMPGPHVRPTGRARAFKGWIDEMAVYKRELTLVEVRRLYKNGKP